MADTMRVKVVDGYAVYDGHEQRGGSELEMPVELAEQWLAAGWVELAPKVRRRRSAE